MRKGYSGEYKVKKFLENKYGKMSVFKLAIGSHGPDFIIINNEGKVVGFIEVKTTNKTEWKPNTHDKRQFEKLIKPLKQIYKSVPIIYYVRTKHKWNIYQFEEIEKIMCDKCDK